MKKKQVNQSAFLWALQGLCTLHRKPFSVELALQQLAPPYTTDSLAKAAQAYGLDAVQRNVKQQQLHKELFPVIAWLMLIWFGTGNPSRSQELSSQICLGPKISGQVSLLNQGRFKLIGEK